MITNQPPTDLLQSALDHAYARGWHDGFVAGQKETTIKGDLADTRQALRGALDDRYALRCALWHVHTLLTSDGGDTVTPTQIVAHCERALGWNRHGDEGEWNERARNATDKGRIDYDR